MVIYNPKLRPERNKNVYKTVYSSRSLVLSSSSYGVDIFHIKKRTKLRIQMFKSRSVYKLM